MAASPTKPKKPAKSLFDDDDDAEAGGGLFGAPSAGAPSGRGKSGRGSFSGRGDGAGLFGGEKKPSLFD